MLDALGRRKIGARWAPRTFTKDKASSRIGNLQARGRRRIVSLHCLQHHIFTTS